MSTNRLDSRFCTRHNSSWPFSRSRLSKPVPNIEPVFGFVFTLAVCVASERSKYGLFRSIQILKWFFLFNAAIFEHLLYTIGCLMPFLDHELVDNMPLAVANTISLNFVSHQDIIDMLCYNILPFTLYCNDFCRFQ